jgi:hypothetical protein
MIHPLGSTAIPASGFSTFRGWLPLLIGPPAVLTLVAVSWPRWACMWTLATVIFFGCKWLTSRWRPPTVSPLWRQIGYFFAWPGLDSIAFFDARRHFRVCSTTEGSLGVQSLKRAWSSVFSF